MTKAADCCSRALVPKVTRKPSSSERFVSFGANDASPTNQPAGAFHVSTAFADESPNAYLISPSNIRSARFATRGW